MQFQLQITNRSKKDVQLLSVVGTPILQSVDGKELEVHWFGNDHTSVPVLIALEAGKSVVIKAFARLYNNGEKKRRAYGGRMNVARIGGSTVLSLENTCLDYNTTHDGLRGRTHGSRIRNYSGVEMYGRQPCPSKSWSLVVFSKKDSIAQGGFTVDLFAPWSSARRNACSFNGLGSRTIAQQRF